MKKFCVWFGLLMSTAVFTACGTGIKNSSESSNSSVSMQTQNINIEIEHLVNLGSDPQAYMLYGSYRNEEEYKDEAEKKRHRIADSPSGCCRKQRRWKKRLPTYSGSMTRHAIRISARTNCCSMRI